MKQLVSSLAVALLVSSLVAADALAKGRWQHIKNKANCVVWDPAPKKGVVATWTGVCTNGKTNGKGTLTWRHFEKGEVIERRYSGTMRNGIIHGSGAYLFPGGQRYEGQFKSNMRHGRGVIDYANGNRFEGVFVENSRHGHGVFMYTNGDRFEGEYRNGSRHGRGVYLFASGNSYEGEFENDMWHGQGVFKFAGGNECAGNWRDGELVGTGRGIRNGRSTTCRREGRTFFFGD